ncbi:MAG: helix-turn-helix transcriptional regulator [Desulfobacterales bacterium]|jgi:transcriptional regulator with XRE-family HTH domain|nr:helix-turn-helix transcriptional regulator [Desulfobacterales bacterium]
MRKKKVEIKIAIYRSGLNQRKFAKKVGLGENLLSMIISGAYIPSDEQMSKIADALGKNEAELF